MRYFTFFSILLMTVLVQAQAPRGFYVAAGVNQSSFSSNHLLADPSIGYKAGINFNFGYHETYNYQIEVMYNHSTFDALTVDADYQPLGNTKLKYDTVDLAFFVNYYLIKPDEDKFFLGPQAGINFSVGGGQISPADEADTSVKYYLPYLLTDNELMNIPKITYGAGLGLTGGYNDFRFDMRYTLGLNNVLKDTQVDSYDEFGRYTGPSLDGKLNTLSFSISYMFGL